MRMAAAVAVLVLAQVAEGQAPVSGTKAAAFDVATVRPVERDEKAGRYITMQGPHRFIAKDFTLKLLIAAAYDLNSRAISGGPAWVDSDHFNIEAITPGEAKPSRRDQMVMLRGLLAERFKLTFHRQEKEFSIYELSVAKGGAKMKASAPSDEQAALISTVYPQKIVMPARNATMEDFVAILQRAVMDRPVVNKTGLQGKFDFDLEWAPDETQFGGEVPVAPSDAPSPPLFVAMQEQLGLKLEATKGPVSAFVIDTAEKPSAD
jgi:uncharacterized protein (TIGR03435 family)